MSANLWALIQLIILFLVIFDPFVSFSFFTVATEGMNQRKKRNVAIYAIIVASAISYTVLIFGETLLKVFSTDMQDFRVAGGIVLAMLGFQMVFGKSLVEVDTQKSKSSQAIAAIIATPLITGPAAITTIIVTAHDYGRLLPGVAITIILALTAVLLLVSTYIKKIPDKFPAQVMSTILGIITLAWGITFIREGLGF